MDEISVLKKELVRLLNEWDPLGVFPFRGGPKDEYDCFVEPILSLLYGGKSKAELVEFLKTHLKEHMGIDPEHSKPEEFAERIVKWWKQIGDDK